MRATMADLAAQTDPEGRSGQWRPSLFEPVPPAQPWSGDDEPATSLFEPVTQVEHHQPISPAAGPTPESPAERTVHLPPAVSGLPVAAPFAAELTNPLPRVAAHQPEHLTAGLPLLDLLAPQHSPQYPEPAPLPPFQPAYQPEPYYQQERPLSGYGMDMPLGGSYPSSPLAPTPPPVSRPRQQRPARRPLPSTTKLVIGMGAGVLLLAVLGLWALDSPPKDTARSGGSTRSTSAAAQTSVVKAVDGYQFTQNASRSDADCAANAYGKVADFFRDTPCAALDRVLYLTTVDGRPAVVSLAMVRMPDEAGAVELKKLVDTTGTGNVSDLLKAGVQAPGGPPSLSSAGYASARHGDTVVVAEADFADPAVRDQELLDRVSTAALQLHG